ncbi:MAG TPA: alpha/beta hydrolase [Candidatus Binatia bacterium]|nr:alpha/beta hydrolase [Candidatus Binatia bacterium]
MSETVYKGFRREELEFQFNPQLSVPEYPQLSTERRQKSQRVRARVKFSGNVPYGDTPRQVMDIFPAGETHAPVLLYVHGGYWRGGSKDDNCNFVDLFTERGVAVAVMEYDLCPQVTVRGIVREVRSAVAWSYRNISRYGGDPSRLYIAGHSAGAHLVAMALAHDWEQEGLPRNLVRGAVATSGVYDLDMVMHVSVNAEIRMTPELAQENSPYLNPPRPICPMLVGVGGAEPDGWQRMSREFFELCKEQGLECEYLVVPGANHYSMSSHLADPDSPLFKAIFKLIGRPAA